MAAYLNCIEGLLLSGRRRKLNKQEKDLASLTQSIVKGRRHSMKQPQNGCFIEAA